MNKEKLLQQLALAKQAGTKAMAKDFFAKVPGSSPAEGSPEEEAAEAPDEASAEGDTPGGDAGDASGLSPEQLQELLRMLGGDVGGGAQ